MASEDACKGLDCLCRRWQAFIGLERRTCRLAPFPGPARPSSKAKRTQPAVDVRRQGAARLRHFVCGRCLDRDCPYIKHRSRLLLASRTLRGIEDQVHEKQRANRTGIRFALTISNCSGVPMAANTSVAIPTDRATGTTPEVRFFVPFFVSENRYALGRSRSRPPSSNTGVRIFLPPLPFPVLARKMGIFFFTFFSGEKS